MWLDAGLSFLNLLRRKQQSIECHRVFLSRSFTFLFGQSSGNKWGFTPKIKFSFSSLFQTSQLYYSTSASLQPAQKMYHCHSLMALTASEVAQSATHYSWPGFCVSFCSANYFPSGLRHSTLDNPCLCSCPCNIGRPVGRQAAITIATISGSFTIIYSLQLFTLPCRLILAPEACALRHVVSFPGDFSPSVYGNVKSRRGWLSRYLTASKRPSGLSAPRDASL